MAKLVICLNLVLASMVLPARAQVLEGLVQLDKTSFDKIVSKFEYSLIKFDVGYPTGDKHKNFGKVATQITEVDNLFMGEVRIKDYGDKNNEDREKIVFAAESWAKEKGEDALVYVKIMKAALDTGYEGIEKEVARVEKVMDNKASDKVKSKMSRKMNVLSSFVIKDEL